MPKFAANLSMLFREHADEERVLAARDAGFAAVEVQFPYTLPAVSWRRWLDEAGVPLVLFNVDAGDLLQGGDGLAAVPGRERAFAEALEECVAYARLLRPRCVNVLAGRVPEGVAADVCRDVFRRNLALAVDRLAPLDIKVTVEAINRHDMPRFLLGDFRSMQAIAAEVPGVRIQFDIYHMAMAGEPVEALIAAEGAGFGHVQFADLPGRHEPGSGTLDFRRLFRALDESGYAGWCGAEYRPLASTADSLAWHCS